MVCCAVMTHFSDMTDPFTQTNVNPLNKALPVELKSFLADQASKTIETSGRKNNCTIHVKANSLKMIDVFVFIPNRN